MNKELVAAQKKGRHGDTVLAHISPKEALALTLNGGAGTKNPKTGLPEFFDFGNLFSNPIQSILHGLLYELPSEAVKVIGGGVKEVGNLFPDSTPILGGMKQLGQGMRDYSGPISTAAMMALGAYGAGGGFAAPGLESAAGMSTGAETLTAADFGAAGLGAGEGAAAPAAFDLSTALTPTATALAEETAAAGNYGGLTQAGSVFEEAPLAANPALSAVPAPATPLPAPAIPAAATPGYMGEGVMSPAEMSAIDAGSGATKFMDNPLQWTGEAITNNPFKSLIALNALNSLNKADMMKGGNEAQQQSYSNYLGAINPDETTKNAQLNVLKSNISEQSGLAQRRLDDTLAARGIRGKGRAAPTGDISEAQRKAENEAYNQIFGKFNVPGAPGPANYSPSAGNLAMGDATSVANQLLALQLARGR